MDKFVVIKPQFLLEKVKVVIYDQILHQADMRSGAIYDDDDVMDDFSRLSPLIMVVFGSSDF